MSLDPAEVAAEEAAPLRAGSRRWLFGVLRLVVSVAMLTFLGKKINDQGIDHLIPSWTASSTAWFVLALVLTFASILLSAVRWQAVLRALGQQPKTGRLVSLYLAGQFVANVLPTSIGGDVLRVSRLSKDSGESHTAFASVVLERMTGWIVLPVITFVGLAVNPGLRDLGKATEMAVAFAVGTLIGLVIVLFAVSRHRYEEDLDEAKGWRRFLGAVSFGLHQLRQRPLAAAEVLAVGFVYQLVLVLSALAAARALGLSSSVGLTALLAFLPAVLIAQVLPISIAGLGVREGLFTLFLGALHPSVPASQAIALGLMLYVLNLLVSLLGAPAFALGAKHEPKVAA